MVHERHEPDEGILDEGREVRQTTCSVLTSQRMWKKCSARQEPGGLRAPDRLGERSRIARPLEGVHHVAHRQTVEDGGDAGGGELGVVRHHRREDRPLDLRPRHRVLLQHVGVELDQPGEERVALEVEGAAHAGIRPGGDVRDDATRDVDGAREAPRAA